MLPSYGQSTTAIYTSSLSRGYSSWSPTVWPLLSSGPHTCLVTSSCIRVLILSGLKTYFLHQQKTRKTCTNSTIRVNTSSRGTVFHEIRMLWTIQVCSNGLLLTLQAFILVTRYPLRRYNFYALTDSKSDLLQ